MSETAGLRDPWRAAAFGLWEIILLAGLLPEPVFRALRVAGRVLPQHAIINSPYAITAGLAAFVALFAYSQCRAHGFSPGESADKALQHGVVALVAFLPVDFIGLIGVIGNMLIPNKFPIYVSVAAKTVAWIYVTVLVCRYYLGDDNAFVKMPSIFPSTRRGSDKEDSAQ